MKLVHSEIWSTTDNFFKERIIYSQLVLVFTWKFIIFKLDDDSDAESDREHDTGKKRACGDGSGRQ